MIKGIEGTMYSIVRTWVELHSTINQSQYKTAQQEEENQLKVEELANKLKQEFEKNDKLINELELPQKVDPENIQKEHRNAVLDYKWVVREMLVWGEQIDRKIDNTLADRPEDLDN